MATKSASDEARAIAEAVEQKASLFRCRICFELCMRVFDGRCSYCTRHNFTTHVQWLNHQYQVIKDAKGEIQDA